MPEASINLEALYAALDQERQARELSWRALAAELGITPSTFTRMVQGHRPDADTFAAMVQWLGLPMNRFVVGGHQPETMEIIGTYLRMDRHITPEAARALEDALRTMYNHMRNEQSTSR